MIFSRATWTYSNDGIDFYRRRNRASFNIDERKVLRNLDLRNAIVRVTASEELRKKSFENGFLMDILAIGGGFYLSQIFKKVEVSEKLKEEILVFSENDENYSFSRFMDGEDDLCEDFLGFFAAKIIEGLVKHRKLTDITEKDIFDEIQKI